MNRMQPFLNLIAVAAAVVGLSWMAHTLWGGKSEEFQLPDRIVANPEMTLQSFQEVNELPDKVMDKLFGRAPAADRAQTLGERVPNLEKLSADALAALAVAKEHATKSWVKIPIKFALWFLFLGFVFRMLVRQKVTAANRNGLYLASFAVFGVILGSDPSPMGTVKDAITLFAKSGAIFPPRMVALAVFLILVIVANKFICSWGCQLGTLQDFIFRLGRNKRDNGHGAVRQRRIPFVVSNSIRVLSCAVFTVIAFAWSVDIIGLVDPFKVFHPSVLTAAGAVFVGILLLGSLFVYRPWCHLFCPFGLVGWIAEKLSVQRIRVDYGKCIACGKCEAACPSDVMSAILRRHRRTIPDCFSCGTCVEVCPTKAISFSRGRRNMPPEGKFSSGR